MKGRAIGGHCPPQRTKQPGSDDSRIIRAGTPPRRNPMVDLAQAATARSAAYRAKRAGVRRPAAPMSRERRVIAYASQTGWTNDFTPRQRRRLDHKSNRALTQAGAR